MCDFHLQQNNAADLDLEAWVNDTVELILSYKNNSVYSSCAQQQTTGQEELTKQFIESRRESTESTDSVAKNNNEMEYLVCKDELKRRKNYFGREYVVGRPLPLSTRLAVIELFNTGAKSCEIAAKLNITHGCASKILKRYKTTGSAEAKKIGGSSPTKTVPAVVEAIIKYKTEEPWLRTWEIRDRLTAEVVCDKKLMPTISSINRILRIHFGPFCFRRRKRSNESGQSISNSELQLEGDFCDRDTDKEVRNMSRQSSNESESSETSLQEMWCPQSVLEEFFHFPA